MASLGSQWEQDVFATTNTAYWNDSWRHRCLFRAVRVLGHGARAHRFLVLLAASLLVGRWFARAEKADYVVSLSLNNDRAFAALNEELVPADGPVFVVNRARMPVWRRIAILCRSGSLAEAGRVLTRQGSRDPRVRAMQVFGIACGLLFQADLRRSGAQQIAVANDHSPPSLALLRLGGSLGIPRIYVQHAPVTPHFPPLDVELAILRDARSVETYRAAARRMAQPWRPEICHIRGTPAPPLAPARSFTPGMTVCLALSMYPDLAQVAEFVQALRRSGAVGTVSLRPHPRYTHPDLLTRTAAQLATPLLAADGDLDRLVRETGIFVVSNSGLGIELLQRGAPVVFADALDHQHRDYYGLVEAGLLPELTADALADAMAGGAHLAEIFTPAWQARVRALLTSGGTRDDAALLRRLCQIRLSAGESFAGQSGEAATVSVVIPAHNRIATLPDAIFSARNQSHPPFEIIVVDDGSVDGTAAMVKADFPDVILVSLPQQSGACAARNAGIARASGSHIAFLDSDDAFLPDKLHRQLGAMRRTGARFATCGKRLKSGRVELTRQLDDRRLSSFNFRGGTSGLIAGTGLMREVQFDPTMSAAQDWELFLRLSASAAGVHVPEALYLYGTGAANRITLSKRRRFLGHVQLYRRHIRGTSRNTLRVHLVHMAIQAMLRADLRDNRLCWLAADTIHRLLR